MPADRPDSFVQSLRQFAIVSGTQADDIARTVQPRFTDAPALAQELVRRGFLTAFQADRVLQGDAQTLVIEPYRLLDRLGEGGMGEVYRARHARTNRIVALKVIHKDRLGQSEATERFFREAQVAARLGHPSIVAAIEAGQAGDVHFLAMDYVDGVDLARLVRQSRPLDIAQACEVARQAALGLQHAFEKGIVHRDIKPANLLVGTGAADGSPMVKILDFGLARFDSETGEHNQLTKVGKVIGTIDFISPEQAENARKADTRSDIYSLGCTLFYALTGYLPFPGNTPLERLSARLVGKAKSIRTRRPEVPEALELIVARMLARDPAKRFQTPAEVAAALAPFAAKPKTRRAAKGTLRRVLTVGATAMAAVACSAVIAVIVWTQTSGSSQDQNVQAPARPDLPPAAPAPPPPKAPPSEAGSVPAEPPTPTFKDTAPSNPNPKRPDMPMNTEPAPTKTIKSAPPVPRMLSHEDWMREVEKRPPTEQRKYVIDRIKQVNGGVDAPCDCLLEDGEVRAFWVHGRAVSDIAPVAVLKRLHSFDCSRTKVSSLLALKYIDTLKTLDCSDTEVNDLSPLDGLHQLTTFCCRNTPVKSLMALQYLANLHTIDCVGAPVASLSPLHRAQRLTRLDCDWKLAAENTLYLRRLKKLETIAALPEKEFWERAEKEWVEQVQDLPAREQLEKVRKKLIERNADYQGKLRTNRGTAFVTELDFDGDPKVKDIEPLRMLTRLEVLKCNGTGVDSLEPLRELRGLTHLNCRACPVSTLEPLRNLELRSLDCSDTKVRSLEPIRTMKKLKRLLIDGAPVSTVEPLRALTLTELKCRGMSVNLKLLEEVPLETIWCDLKSAKEYYDSLYRMNKKALKTVNGERYDINFQKKLFR